MKHSNLYLGLVLPSGGWQSLIVQEKWICREKYLVTRDKHSSLFRWSDSDAEKKFCKMDTNISAYK